MDPDRARELLAAERKRIEQALAQLAKEDPNEFIRQQSARVVQQVGNKK